MHLPEIINSRYSIFNFQSKASNFRSSLILLLILLLISCLAAAGSSISTNKTFILQTNNALPPDETNFFVANSNLLNQSVLPSSGGGGGGVPAGVLTNNAANGWTNLGIDYHTNQTSIYSNGLVQVQENVTNLTSTNNGAQQVGINFQYGAATFAGTVTANLFNGGLNPANLIWSTQTAGSFFGGPTFGTANPVFRNLVMSDMPIGILTNNAANGWTNLGIDYHTNQTSIYSNGVVQVQQNVTNLTSTNNGAQQVGINFQYGAATFAGTVTANLFNGGLNPANLIWSTQTAGSFFGGPTVGTANPAFRNLVMSDMPVGLLTNNASAGWTNLGKDYHTNQSSIYSNGVVQVQQNVTNLVSTNGGALEVAINFQTGAAAFNGAVAAGSLAGNGTAVTGVMATNIVGPYFTNIQVVADNCRSNLNQYKVVGSSVWSMGSNTITLTGINGEYYGDFLVNTNFGDPFHWQTFHVKVNILQTNATVSELGFGTLSQSHPGGSSLFFGLDTSDSSLHGNVNIWFGPSNGPSPFIVSPTKFNYQTNSPFDVWIVRRDENFTCTFSNSASYMSFSYSYLTDTQSQGGETAGWGYPGIWCCGQNTANIEGMSNTVDTYWPVNTLLIGDSITSGFGSTDPQRAWARRLQASMWPKVVDIDAAQSAVTSDYTNFHLAGILMPSNIVYLGGANNIYLGSNIITCESEITNFVGLNSGYCKRLYIGTPLPQVSNAIPLVTFVETNYPASNWIDLFTPLTTITTNMVAEKALADGVHPNDAGSGTVFSILNSRLNVPQAAP